MVVFDQFKSIFFFIKIFLPDLVFDYYSGLFGGSSLNCFYITEFIPVGQKQKTSSQSISYFETKLLTPRYHSNCMILKPYLFTGSSKPLTLSQSSVRFYIPLRFDRRLRSDPWLDSGTRLQQTASSLKLSSNSILHQRLTRNLPKSKKSVK